MNRQRGFAIPQLMLGVIVVAILAGAFFMGYRAGANSERATSEKRELAAIAAGQARAADVSDAIKEGQDRAAVAAGRAAGNDEKNREALRAARRNNLVFASCPAALVAGPSPFGSGLQVPRAPAGGDPGVRLNWRFVGLFLNGHTGNDGQPLFGAASQFALAPERADAASQYGLFDVLDVENENAVKWSQCRRDLNALMDGIQRVHAAWGIGPQ